jgi:acyl-CoA oxidase
MDLLRASDLGTNPERFFEAHRLLAQHTVAHGPGFWIRFTVHYNLCMGTVLAVGTDAQVASLDAYQAAGQLGCFSLTEKLAGVQSGLVVETTATYDDADGGSFVLHTPHDGARKNWISQGFVADKTVVLADLIVQGQSMGPHAFVMDLRRDGALAHGVTVADMGRKTVGNDLDNAWIAFDHVRLPKAALLSKHADVVNGQYELLTAGVRPFDLIGQRLYTGRVAVAQAALEYRKVLFAQAQAYSDAKRTYARSPEETPVLSEIPQLKALYTENAAKVAEIESFVGACEAALCQALRQGAVPSAELVDAIATAKVRAVEDSIAFCFRLKQEVGSFALMHDAGFRHLDFLQCCKFAGEST